MTVDLDSEFEAAYAAFDGLGERGLLRAQQLDIAFEHIGLSRVVIRKGARYEPAAELFEIGDGDGFGKNALIVPVLDRSGQYLDDLVAVLPELNVWGRRLCDACALGFENAWDAIAAERAVRLAPSPLDWLRHPWDAVCVLDWNADPVEELLRAAPALIVPHGDETFAEFVHKHLRRPLPRPRNPDIHFASPPATRIVRWQHVPTVARRVECAFDRD